MLLVLFSTTAEARLPRQTSFESVRALGMGNAFLALADDSNAIFYNPAGLARVKGLHFNLIDLTLGADSLDSASRLKEAVFRGDYSNLIRRDSPEYLRLGVKPVLTGPYFGLALFDDVRGFFDLKNLESLDAQVDIYTVNDLGAALGIGIPAGEYVSFGATARVFQRTEVDVFYTAEDLFEMLGTNRDDFLNAVYQKSRELAGLGWGIGLNLGALIKVPLGWKSPQLQIAATIEDVGMTNFRPFGGAPTPDPIPATYHLGASLNYTLTKDTSFKLAADLRNNFQPLPFMNQLHLGGEYDHRFFALRAGMYHGYPTAGATIKLAPHTRVHAATYAMEQGNQLWERHQRWYLLQLVIGFNPF